MSSPIARYYVIDKGPDATQQLKTQLNLSTLPSPIMQSGYLGLSSTHAIKDADSLAIRADASAKMEFSAAFKSVSAYPVQIAIVPPAYLRRTMRELMPEMPKQLGGGSSLVLADGLRWVAIGIDPATLKFELMIQSISDAQAKGIVDRLPKLLEFALQQLSRTQRESLLKLQNLANLQSIINEGRVTYKNSSTLDAAQWNKELSAALGLFTGQISRQSKMDRFKQIALACHNFSSAFSVLPPGNQPRDSNGKLLLSWRVHILPFLGEADLYKQFRLNEPWDSLHNLPLVKRIPKVFMSTEVDLFPSSRMREGYTSFVAPSGDDTIFGQVKPVRFADITDGTSNTIWLVEVKPEFAVPWTSPDDYSVEKNNPSRGLNLDEDGMFLYGMADGSAGYRRMDGEADKLLHRFQKSDGFAVD
ncbi:MAG TPA: DUF1559 domain-containing protein [Pirellula sp.]|nr:DUF1559 domain-containing protein [Pirellula sp.]